MLRTILSAKTGVHRRMSCLLSTGANPMSAPNSKNSVILKKFAPSVTNNDLTAALKDVYCRKIELQPGCVIHTTNEAAANKISHSLQQKFSAESHIAKASLPAIHLQNIPSNVTTGKLLEAFQHLQPKVSSINGAESLQVVVNSADDALAASAAIKKIALNGENLHTSIVKLNNAQYVVQVHAISNGIPEEVRTAVNSAVSGLSQAQVTYNPGAKRSVQLRFSSDVDMAKVSSIIGDVFKGQSDVEIIAGTPLKIPSLLLRGTRGISESTLEALLKSVGSTQIIMNKRSADVRRDLVVAHFDSEDTAMAAYQKLRKSQVDGRKVSVSFKEISSPAMELRNLPPFDEAQIKALFTTANVLSVRTYERDGQRCATAVLSDPSDVYVAQQALHGKVIAGRVITAESVEVQDTGVSIVYHGNVAEERMSALLSRMKSEGVHVKGTLYKSNVNAFVGFQNLNLANDAIADFNKGKISFHGSQAQGNTGSMVTSQLSSMPAFVVDVNNLSVDTPLSEVTAHLNQEGDAVAPYILDADRFALVKFKRSVHVPNGIKAMKNMKIGGQGFKIIRYDDSEEIGDSGFDLVSKDIDEFDRQSLRYLLTDYLDSDPATRYKIAKNQFERSLTDAQTQEDVSYLLDSKYSSPEMVKEAKLLLSQPLTSESTQRLFDLYIQRDDMLQFSSDFKDMIGLFGPVNEEDPLNWTQFEMATSDDLDSITAAMAKRSKDLESGQGQNKTMRDYLVEGDDNLDHVAPMEDADPTIKDEIRKIKSVEVEHEGEEVTINLEEEEVKELEDSDGRVWSGCIMHADVVQRTMPQNRVNSHRVLVVVGNMRGVAGFGVGKGQDTNAAVDSAFRDALRNLTFIDLYDNFGFAHDLYGKHNSCRCYIRATPRTRMMVASPFATEVLNRFGVSSASVKLVGRRNPYSMMRSLFKAVSNHQNLDEIAKARGKRYLTLKWLQDHSV